MEYLYITLGILLGVFVLIFLVIIPLASIRKNSNNRSSIYRKHRYTSGNFGEQMVQDILGADIPGEYYVYNNLRFKYKNKVVEIDHVVISKYGIFVIETKDWYGFVTIDNDSKKWILDNGREERHRQDPIQQNWVHIKRLQEILCIKHRYFNNIVCFSERADISTINSKFICYITELRERLILEHEYLTEENIIEIKENLDNFLDENGATTLELEKYHTNRQYKNTKDLYN